LHKCEGIAVKKILVLLDVMVFFDRELFRGIQAALKTYSTQSTVYLSSQNDIDSLRLTKWDVVIADGDKVSDINAISSLANLCLIYSSSELNDVPKNVHVLSLDNEQFASLALGKFLDLGIKQVGFYCNEFDDKFLWNRERKHAFLEHAKNVGLSIIDMQHYQPQRNQEQMGVFCSTDRSARTLLQSLSDQRVMIPQQVAVIGVDCDPIENEISPISITSIDINPFDIGKQAVQSVFSLRRNQHHRYTASHIEINDSCREDYQQDTVVSQALFYIYNNYQNPIKVSTIARYCRVSRKTLDTRFLNAKGITVHQYIVNTRVERAKKYLIESDESIEEIAMRCGYPHHSYLYQVFKKHMNCTPVDYRKSFRGNNNKETDRSISH
jgi:AraC-like DNA-binding protein